MELGALSRLSSLWLSEHALSGGIPAELGALPNLSFLYLSGNALTGCVPPALRSVASTDVGSLGLAYCER